MDTLTLLILILAVIVVAFVAFATIQHKRRAGGVIAAKPRRPKGGS